MYTSYLNGRRRELALIFSLLACFSGVLEAQNYDNPGLGELPVSAHPQDYKPLGVRAGGFMLHPGVQLAAEFNDNVFYTAQDEVDDTVWHVRPYITAQSNWNRHALNLRLAADIARFDTFGTRDYEDYFLLINGRVDVRNRSYFSYTADYMRLHEDFNSRDAEQGREPTRYDLMGGSLGYDHTFNRLSVGGLFGLRRLDFEDAIALDGSVLDNQDRNRDESFADLRFGYQFQTDKQAFVRFSWNSRDYDQFLDRNGIHRNSDGWAAHAGLLFNITGKLDGDVYVSYHDQSFDDPRLPGVNGWAGGAGLQWRPTLLTSVGARIMSSVQPTTLATSSGYLRTVYSVRVDHELTRSLQLNGQVSYGDNDYQLTPDAPVTARTSDEIWQYGLGLNYFINRWLFVSAAYTHDRLRSNVPGDEYDVNRIWLTLSLER
jgi:hypothetical protein